MPPKKKAAETKGASRKAAGKTVKSARAKTTATRPAKTSAPRKSSTPRKSKEGRSTHTAGAKRASASAARAPVKSTTTQATPKNKVKSDKAKADKTKSDKMKTSKPVLKAKTSTATERKTAKASAERTKTAAKATTAAGRKASAPTKAAGAAVKQNAGKVPHAAKTAKVSHAGKTATKSSSAKSAPPIEASRTKPAARPTVEGAAKTPKTAKQPQAHTSKAPASQAPASQAQTPTTKAATTASVAAKAEGGKGSHAAAVKSAHGATNKRDAASRPAATQMAGDTKPAKEEALAERPVRVQTPTGRVRTADTKSVAAALLAARRKTIPAPKPANDAKPQANGGVDPLKGGDEVADKTVKKVVVSQEKPAAPVPPSQTASQQPPMPAAGMMRRPLGALRPGMPGHNAAIRASKPVPKQSFKTNEFIVYPAHGVGQIIAIESQEVAGYKLELFVISFVKDKMILKVPLPKIASVGMRKLAEAPVVKRALDTLTGRARIKRTMWSRRAQEYEAKINSGDLIAIAEVVRDLYRSDAQPEQSYSERQLYEAALDRLARELSVVQSLTDTEALKLIDDQLRKGPRRGKPDENEADEADETDDASGDMGEAA